METPWYKVSFIGSFIGIFRGVGNLFNSTFNAMFTSAGTDFFSSVLLLILFGLVAGFLLYMFRNTRK